jgi:hypothetical protein
MRTLEVSELSLVSGGTMANPRNDNPTGPSPLPLTDFTDVLGRLGFSVTVEMVLNAAEIYGTVRNGIIVVNHQLLTALGAPTSAMSLNGMEICKPTQDMIYTPNPNGPGGGYSCVTP